MQDIFSTAQPKITKFKENFSNTLLHEMEEKLFQNCEGVARGRPHPKIK